MNIKNPYPTKSLAAHYWNIWAAKSREERQAFVRHCEAMPAGAMHGALSTEWDIVAKMVAAEPTM